MWHSRLGIWRYHCSGSGLWCGASLIPDPRTFTCQGSGRNNYLLSYLHLLPLVSAPLLSFSLYPSFFLSLSLASLPICMCVCVCVFLGPMSLLILCSYFPSFSFCLFFSISGAYSSIYSSSSLSSFLTLCLVPHLAPPPPGPSPSQA